MRTLRGLVGLLGVAVALAACDALKDVMTLATALDKQFHVPMNVNINNGSHLVITVVNAPQGAASDSEREEFAHQVAAFAATHYPHPQSLDDVVVAYSDVDRKGPVTFTRGEGSYRWNISDLAAPSATDTGVVTRAERRD